MRWLISLALLVSVGLPAHAQEREIRTAEAMEIIEQIQALNGRLDGMTATLRGAISSMSGDPIMLTNDLGSFEIQFDAGREARRLVADCPSVTLNWSRSNCIFDVDVEFQVRNADLIHEIFCMDCRLFLIILAVDEIR